MRFSQFLVEKPMNAATYAGVERRLANRAMVGFEFEMLIPADSHLYVDPSIRSDNREFQRISWFDTLSEFEEVFEIGRVQRRQINDAYEEWVDAHRDDWIQTHWMRHLDQDADDQDQAEKDAKEEAESNFPADKYEFRDWLKSEFAYNYHFADAFNLEPKYGWAEETPRFASVYTEPAPEGGEEYGTFEEISASLNKQLDIELVVRDSHNLKPKKGDLWYLEPDSSIHGNGHGAEIISPPMPLKIAIETMSKMFKWMERNEAETNDSTGFHINVSLKDMTAFDPVKFVLMLGEKYVLADFGRSTNSFTNSQMDYIINQLQKGADLPKREANAMIDRAEDLLSVGKYFSVNFSHLKSAGYLEVRMAGGHDYHMDTDKMAKTVYRICTALESACSTVMDREEYIKKLMKLFDRARETINTRPLSPESMVAIPKELTRLQRYDPGFMQDFGDVEASTGSVKRNRLLSLLWQSVKSVKRMNSSLTLPERVAFKKLIKDAVLDSHDADRYFVNADDRLLFKKEIGI